MKTEPASLRFADLSAVQTWFETQHYNKMAGLTRLVPDFGDAGGPELQ